MRLSPGLLNGPAVSTKRSGVALMVALGACFAVSAVGGLLTSTSVGTWYQTLDKPTWTPPGWLFGPVWFTLYAMMAIAVWDAWRAPGPSRRAVTLFAVQLGLNLAWSALFFGLRRPGLALIEIILLIGLIVATMVEFSRRRRRAAWLLVPYLAWTSFAAALNAAIWWANRAN